MTTPFHDSLEPITTRVVVTTEFETWMFWEHARMIDPPGMEHATFLHATRHKDGTVDVTLEIPRAALDYLIAAVGREYALSALEECLRQDAAEIIEAADLEDALRLIPVTEAVPLFNDDTFAVSWSASDAVMVFEAIGKAENDLQHVRLARMEREGDKLLLAVTLPPHLAEEIRATSPSKAEAGFPDAVLDRLVALMQEGPFDAWPDDVRLPDSDETIPF